MKLTNRTIDALPPGPEKGRWYADDDLSGFYAVRYPEAVHFAVRYRVNGRRRALRLGAYGKLTAEGARDAAKKKLARAELGEDPALEKKRKRAIPTWGAWTETYLDRVRGAKKSDAQDERYLGLAENGGEVFKTIRRQWAARTLTEITPDDIFEARKLVRDTPVQANRWVASVRACLAAAISAGHLTKNPARDVPKFLEGPPRQRVLSQKEADVLLLAIEAEDDPHARAGLLLLLETGRRLTEALRARWEDVSGLEGPDVRWTILSPKAGTPQTVPLPASVVKVLRRLPRVGPFIVAGYTEGAPRRDLKGPWARALSRAGLAEAGLTIHDLRRSHGLAVYKESGLLAAQKLLGHADSRITAKVYAPLAAEDLRDAQEARSRSLRHSGRKTGRRGAGATHARKGRRA